MNTVPVANTHAPLRRQQLPALIALFVLIVALSTLWLRLHPWEAYMYASMVEGFFHVSDMFAAFSHGETLPDLSRFHPYHPLLHIGIRALFQWWGGSALTIAVVVNKCAAVATAVLVYRIACMVLHARWPALFATIVFCCTKAFLIAAFSGEAHLLSYALFLASLDVTLRYVQAQATPNRPSPLQYTIRAMALAASYYGLGAGMNLAVFFYGILPAAILIHAKQWRALLLALTIGGMLIFMTYVVLPMVIFDLDSFQQLRSLFEIYPNLPKPDDGFAVRLWDVVAGIAAGGVAGVDPSATAARVVLGTLIAAGAIVTWVLRPPTHRLPRWLGFWVVGFAVGEMALNTAKSVNGTVYILLAVTLVLTDLLSHPRLPRPIKHFAFLALLAIAGNNIYRTLITKISIDEASAHPLLKLPDILRTPVPVAVQLTHMSLFESIYTLGHQHGFHDLHTIVTRPADRDDAVFDFMRAHDSMCILSSVPIPPHYAASLVNTRVTLSPDAYHFSVNHPESYVPVVKQTHLACRLRRRT